MVQLHSAGRVAGHVGQRQQVGATDEEVAVEVGDAQTLGGAHAHDRLEARVAGEVVDNVGVEALCIAGLVEGSVLWRGGGERSVSTRVQRQRGREWLLLTRYT